MKVYFSLGSELLLEFVFSELLCQTVLFFPLQLLLGLHPVIDLQNILPFNFFQLSLLLFLRPPLVYASLLVLFGSFCSSDFDDVYFFHETDHLLVLGF
jgi:hypothetical protein